MPKIGYSKDGIALGRAKEFEENSALILPSLPRGAYTAARTGRKRSSIFLLDFHLKRLVDSRRLLLADDPESVDYAASYTKEEIDFVECSTLSMSAAIQSLNMSLDKEESECEAMLIVVVTLEYPIYVFAYAVLLPRSRPDGACVEVRTGPRSRPRAKDTLWATLRKTLEKQRLPGVEETILSDEEGNLLEGCTSNFFVFMNNALYTAPNVILPGSVREAILQKIAPEIGLEVVLEAPTLESRGEWTGAFIANANRLITWVSSVKFPEQETVSDLTLSIPGDYEQIKLGLGKYIDEHSDSIFPLSN